MSSATAKIRGRCEALTTPFDYSSYSEDGPSAAADSGYGAGKADADETFSRRVRSQDAAEMADTAKAGKRVVIGTWSKRIGLGAAAAVTALTIFAGTPQTASAQGLFDRLFGIREEDHSRDRIGESRRSSNPFHRGGQVHAYAPPEHRQGGFSLFDFRPRERDSGPTVSSTPSPGAGVHCVRLCDGRYFPLPRAAGSVRLDPAKVCTALCPAAQTKVFNGGNMQYARANDGTRYSDLDNAFTFREKLVPDCSCTGQGPGGLAQIDIESDPTLREGDVVVTAAGATVFKGSSQFPYKTADFTPVEDYAKINKQMRDTLADLQVNTTVLPVIPPQKIATAGPDEKPAKKVRRVVRTEPRRAERPVTFSFW